MRLYYYLHFTNEETEAERLSNVLVWKRKMFIRKMNSKPSQPQISRNKYCGKGNQGRQETLKRDPKSVSQQQNRTVKPPKTSQTWGPFGQNSILKWSQATKARISQPVLQVPNLVVTLDLCSPSPLPLPIRELRRIYLLSVLHCRLRPRNSILQRWWPAPDSPLAVIWAGREQPPTSPQASVCSQPPLSAARGIFWNFNLDQDTPPFPAPNLQKPFKDFPLFSSQSLSFLTKPSGVCRIPFPNVSLGLTSSQTPAILGGSDTNKVSDPVQILTLLFILCVTLCK